MRTCVWIWKSHVHNGFHIWPEVSAVALCCAPKAKQLAPVIRASSGWTHVLGILGSSQSRPCVLIAGQQLALIGGCDVFMGNGLEIIANVLLPTRKRSGQNA